MQPDLEQPDLPQADLPQTAPRRGWAVDAALTGAFLVLTLLVVLDAGVPRLDRAIRDALPSPYGAGPGGLVGDVAQVVATVANPDVTGVLACLAAVVVAVRLRTLAPLRRAVPVVVGAVLVVALKAVIGRAGPEGVPADGGLGYFPSGHTAMALLGTGAVAALVTDLRPDWRRRAVGVAAAWTVLVAVAMVDHRFHWLSDVVASGLLGLLILRLTCPTSWAPEQRPAPGAAPGRPRAPTG